MKIGIDGRALMEKRTGIGTYTYEIIKSLNKIDDKNQYYIYSNKKIFIDFDLNNNFHICEYKSKIGTFWLYNKLPKILYKDDIEIFWGTQHCLPKRNKFTKKIKYILTIHDLAIFKFKNIGSTYNTIIQYLFLKKSCKNADKIVAISESTKDDLCNILNISNDKIKMIYNGFTNSVNTQVSNDSIKAVLNKFNIKNRKYFFFLSTIEPRKNLLTAVKAFEQFKKNYGTDTKFIISGGVGWKSEKIIKYINNSKYTKDIVMTGYISNVEKEVLYTNCITFLFPSLYEGFGLPILEAFARKSLVITTSASSLPEIGGNAAYYIENVYDYKLLSDKMFEVYSLSQKEKEKRIKLGLEQAKKFNWNDCANKLLKLF